MPKRGATLPWRMTYQWPDVPRGVTTFATREEAHDAAIAQAQRRDPAGEQTCTTEVTDRNNPDLVLGRWAPGGKRPDHEPAPNTVTTDGARQTWTDEQAGHVITVEQIGRLGGLVDWAWVATDAETRRVIAGQSGFFSRHLARAAALRAGYDYPSPPGPTDAEVATVRRFLAFLTDHDCMVAHVDDVTKPTWATAEQQHRATVDHWIATERGETE